MLQLYSGDLWAKVGSLFHAIPSLSGISFVSKGVEKKNDHSNHLQKHARFVISVVCIAFADSFKQGF